MLTVLAMDMEPYGSFLHSLLSIGTLLLLLFPEPLKN